MTKPLEIKAAIEKLSRRDYAELMARLHPSVDDDWDRQIKADAKAGRLDRLVEEARAAAVHWGSCFRRTATRRHGEDRRNGIEELDPASDGIERLSADERLRSPAGLDDFS